MGKRRARLYTAIIDSLRMQSSDEELHRHMSSAVENVTDRRIVKAVMLGFSDSELRDPALLQRLAVLATKHRMLELAGPTPAVEAAVDAVSTSRDEQIAAPESPPVPKKARTRDPAGLPVAAPVTRTRSRRGVNAS